MTSRDDIVAHSGPEQSDSEPSGPQAASTTDPSVVTTTDSTDVVVPTPVVQPLLNGEPPVLTAADLDFLLVPVSPARATPRRVLSPGPSATSTPPCTVQIQRFAELENATLSTVVLVPPQADVAVTSVPPSPGRGDTIMDTAENLTQQPEDTPLPLIPDVTAHGVVSPVAMETVVVESVDPGASCSWAQATEYEDDVPVEGDGLDV